MFCLTIAVIFLLVVQNDNAKEIKTSQEAKQLCSMIVSNKEKSRLRPVKGVVMEHDPQAGDAHELAAEFA